MLRYSVAKEKNTIASAFDDVMYPDRPEINLNDIYVPEILDEG